MFSTINIMYRNLHIDIIYRAATYINLLYKKVQVQNTIKFLYNTNENMIFLKE